MKVLCFQENLKLLSAPLEPFHSDKCTGVTGFLKFVEDY